MHRTIRSLALLALIFATFAGATRAWAQGITGSALTGTITGPDGAPVPNAHVELRNTSTGEVFFATTGADGAYFIDNVPPGGPYTVTAATEGFPPTEQSELQLELGQRLSLDLAFAPKVEEKVEQIQVQRRVDRLNDHGRTGASTTVGQNAISHLPLQGRNFVDLTAVSPLANGNSGGSSIGGANNRYNSIQIDGGANNDLFGLASSGTPGGQTNATPLSIEAVKEFTIQIAPFDVRQSGFTGGLVNAITKSGTNEFHGSAFTYYQNKTLSNTNFIDATCQCTKDDPTYFGFHTLQFGGSVGGPIVENKLYFFVAADLQSKSSSFGSPFQISGTDPASDFGRAGFTNAEAQRFENILATKYGISNAGDALAPDIGNPDYNVFGKLTYSVDEHNRAELSYNFVDATLDVLSRSNITSPSLPASPTAAGNLRDGYQLSNSGYSQANTTNTIRGKFTSNYGDVSNEALAGVSIVRDSRQMPNTLPLILVDLKCTPNPDPNGPQCPEGAPTKPIGQLGASDVWLAAGGERFSHQNSLDQNIYELSDNVTFGLGDHRLTVGTSNEFLQIKNVFFQAAYGVWAFTSPGPLMTGLDAFEAGTPSAFQRRFGVTDQQAPGTADFSVAQFGLYVQDEWRLFKGFTVTPGLRIDLPFLSSAVTNPALVNNTAFPIDTGDVPTGNLLWSPRVGFNWDVEGNSDTIVRGGVGLFTGRPPYVWVSNAYNTNGLTQVQLTCLASMGGIPAFTVDPNNQPSSCTGGTGTPPPPTNLGEIDYFDPGTKYPQNFQVALGGDRRLPWDLTASVDLIYSHDVNGWYTTDANLVQQPGTTAEGRVTYGSFSASTPTSFRAAPTRIDATHLTNAVEVYNKSGSQTLNAAFTLAKKISRAVDVSVSYAYTNSQDLISLTSSQGFSNFQFAPLDGTLTDRNARPSNFDRTHRVTLTGTAQLPYGFNVGAIYIGQSGTPYTWTVNGDVNADGVNGNDLVYVPRNMGEISLAPLTQGGTVITPEKQWSDLDAFINSQDCLNEARGRFVQRGECRNPWSNILNLRLGWGMQTYQKQRFEVQLDIFDFMNLLNSDWGTFDQVTGFENAPVAFLRAVSYDTANNRPFYNFASPLRPDGRVESTVFSPTSSRWRIQLGARYDF